MNNDWIKELVRRHREAGVLLDANLLILWIVGTVDPSLIGEHRKLASYGKPHFDALRWIVAHFTRVVTTPHVLTEASDMAPLIKSSARGAIMAALGQVIGQFQERFEQSQKLCVRQEFVKLGLADVSVMQVAEENVLVLSDDSDLVAELERVGRSVISIRRLGIV